MSEEKESNAPMPNGCGNEMQKTKPTGKVDGDRKEMNTKKYKCTGESGKEGEKHEHLYSLIKEWTYWE